MNAYHVAGIVMVQQQDQFVQNLSRKMLTYAVGRGTEPFDRPTILRLAQSVEDDGYRMQALIEAIVFALVLSTSV